MQWLAIIESALLFTISFVQVRFCAFTDSQLVVLRIAAAVYSQLVRQRAAESCVIVGNA